MTATLSSASVPITSESIRQTSGKYLHQIISTKKEKKRRMRKFDAAKAKVRYCGCFRIRLRIFALRGRMFALELFTILQFRFRNFALSQIRTEDES